MAFHSFVAGLGAQIPSWELFKSTARQLCHWAGEHWIWMTRQGWPFSDLIAASSNVWGCLYMMLGCRTILLWAWFSERLNRVQRIKFSPLLMRKANFTHHGSNLPPLVNDQWHYWWWSFICYSLVLMCTGIHWYLKLLLKNWWKKWNILDSGALEAMKTQDWMEAMRMCRLEIYIWIRLYTLTCFAQVSTLTRATWVIL